jgi:hypothetical protein
VETATFIKVDPEGREVSYDGESTIHLYQRGAKSTYKEAIDHAGYKLYGWISKELFHSCNLYIVQEGNKFCRGYIDIELHPSDGCNDPVRQFIYIEGFVPWVKFVEELKSTSGSKFHPYVRGSIKD